MSNPAVTKLVRTKIGKSNFWMDDNIGESIHIHLDDFRIDLTTEELYTLKEELVDILNKMVQVEGFDINTIDPVYLSLYLYKDLRHLKSVKIDYVNVGELIVSHHWKFGFNKFECLSNSRAVKALKGKPKENDDHRASHHIGQSSAERLSEMKDSIMNNGYPYNGQYIILFEDQNIIRDGQHRASCIFYEQGNVKIPVMRLYFDNPSISELEINLASQIKRKIKNIKIKKLIKDGKAIIKRDLMKIKKLKNSMYFKLHKKELKKMEEIFFQ